MAVVARGLGAAFVPANDAIVLERLRAGPVDATAQELRRLQSELAEHPSREGVAVRAARLYVAKYREESDPRYLGYAQAALRPWWDQTPPPPQIGVLRAIIRQSRHDFSGALADLRQVAPRDPQNAQAWLSLVAVLQTQGDYAAARGACLRLFRLTDELVAWTCSATTAALNGDADKGLTLLSEALKRNASADPAVRRWAATSLAEIAARLGRNDEADARFREALSLPGRDGYLLAAYADFLLDAGRPGEVVTLLAGQTRDDNLLLRLALAENAMAPASPAGSEHVAQLGQRFAASRLRGDAVHRREESRYELHLMRDPAAALRLALENWEVQREPADVRVLLEAAAAAHRYDAARPVLDWLRNSRLEDVHIARLVAEIEVNDDAKPAARLRDKTADVVAAANQASDISHR